MSIKVSVCIPVYGVEKYIEKCARSLFEQTMREDIEFIFVNDCTKDRSIEILEQVLAEYPHRKEQTKIIQHKQNGGLVAARNTGLLHASGEYIIHCDSDDWVELDMYEKMYDAAKENDADISYCSYILDDGKTQKIAEIASYSTGEDFLDKILSNNLHWNLWAKMVKSTIAKSSDLYTPEHICFGEDLLLSSQMIAKSKTIAYYPRPLYHYFKSNTESYTKQFKRTSLDQLREAVDFLEQHLPRQYNLASCKGEVLFKAVFYDLMSKNEFKQYASGWRKKILSAHNFSKQKKIILFSAFISFRTTALLLKVLKNLL